MTEPDFGACEVRFLLPDIHLERSECTMYGPNGGPFSTSYLGDAGIKISGYGRRLTSHARTW